MRAAIAMLVLAACGSAPPPASTVQVHEEPVARERACFTGSVANGVCEIFSAATEPLTAIASHCRTSGGTWLEACPEQGRAGTCEVAGHRSVYYGAGLTEADVARACEAERRASTP